MAEDDGKRTLTTEEMLAEEADAILGRRSEFANLDDRLKGDKGKEQQKKRIRLNADDRSGLDIDRETVEVRRKFYRSLNKLNRAALCLSGGGIRSATFCLGVIQALARYNVNSNPPQPRRSPVPETPSELALRLINSETVFTSEAGIASVALQAEAAELEVRKRAPDAAPPVLEKSRPATPEELGTTNSLLGRLHYLSTI